jgi:DNA-directed RNA polymerase III subunit RPC4
MQGGSRRPVARSNQPFGAAPGSSLSGSSATPGPPSNTPVAAIKKEEKGKAKVMADDEELYSDPDEGVEIIDIDHVRELDFMAPESLKRERPSAKRVKKEDPGTKSLQAFHSSDSCL